MREFVVKLPKPHPKQEAFIRSKAKRKMVKAGRRGGKTVGVGIMASEDFLELERVLYAAPTSEQISRFWATVTRAFEDPIDKGILYKNESECVIEYSEKFIKELAKNPLISPEYLHKIRESRIKAKTAWNADTLRGDYASKLILDEWQLMNEDAWELVGAPMMLDTNGSVVFIYTPPHISKKKTFVSKAKDPQHASKRFARYAKLVSKKPERYAVFHFTSHDNPNLNKEALEEITEDMTSIGYRMEIMAEDVEEAPGALWNRKTIEDSRVFELPQGGLDLIVVGVDPSVSSTGEEAGVIGAGKKGDHGYTLADKSVQGSPLTWAKAAVDLYHELQANKIIAEKNNGGEMVATTIAQVDPRVPVELVWASRGKYTRAEPVSAMAEKGRDHHYGHFPYLEDECCLWQPGSGDSPNRLDAKVWAYYGLKLVTTGKTDWERFIGG